MRAPLGRRVRVEVTGTNNCFARQWTSWQCFRRQLCNDILLILERRTPVQNDVGLPAALFTRSDYQEALAIRCRHVAIAPDFWR